MITRPYFDLKECANYFTYHILKGHIPENTTTHLTVNVGNLTYDVELIGITKNISNTYLQNNELHLNDSVMQMLSEV